MEGEFAQQDSPGLAGLYPGNHERRPGESPASSFTAIAPRDLQQRCSIGSGGFGEVYKARHHSWGIWVAVKYLRVNGSDKQELLEEAKKMHRAQFEHTLRLYGVTEDNMKDGQPSLGLVTEFMEAGSLDKLLVNYDVPWPLRLRFAYEIALGVNYLHNLKPALFHHDLKPANILLNNDYHVKICDFGLAKWRKSTGQYSCESSKFEGTLSYIPPECFKDVNTRGDVKFDVYSYGIIIWEIITCQKPYKNAVNSQQIKLCVERGARPDCDAIPQDLPESAEVLIPLMKKCWHSIPDERPTFLRCAYDLEPTQSNEQDIQVAIQDLTKQKSQSVDGVSDWAMLRDSEDNRSLYEPVEEQDGPINLVEPVPEQNEPIKVVGPLSIPTSEECMTLADLVNRDWKMIGRSLELTEGDISTIDADYDIDGLKEKAYQMFQKWIQKQGRHATRETLFRKFKLMGRSDLVMYLCS
ncbi:receptor-interacting serine/threonine-protein kinase 2-like isoform X2 [Rhincodon typus]|uniref:receptor-interacting serine/threonine-protein kinase 2-like isoform X2 n=1 Tax=Rhincodon typus TaxID=259920 RepID=UPI002030726A|nr:receptor-interacting serine/threonine-protein kinase 2-like isoform X2 [Rhincodon typus]